MRKAHHTGMKHAWTSVSNNLLLTAQDQIKLSFLFTLIYYSISITYIVFKPAISLGNFIPLLEKQRKHGCVQRIIIINISGISGSPPITTTRVTQTITRGIYMVFLPRS